MASIEGFSANPTTLPPGGGQVTFTWQTSNAQGVTLSPGVGAVAAPGHTVLVTQTTMFTLAAFGSSGVPATRDVTVTVEPPITPPPPAPTPRIDSFTVDQANLPVGGGTVKLQWSVSNAKSIVIDHGVGDVTGLVSKDVQVTGSKTFTLTATNDAGVNQRTVSVAVAQNDSDRVGPYAVNGQIPGWTRGSRDVRALPVTSSYAFVGQGAVGNDGGFSLTLTDPRSNNYSLSAVLQFLCGGVQSTVSPGLVRGLTADLFTFTNPGYTLGALYYATSGVLPDSALPVGGVRGTYYFVDQDVRVTGSCGGEDYDLDLRRGWNLVLRERKASGSERLFTGAAPAGTQWRYTIRPQQVSVTAPKTSFSVGETAQFTATALDDLGATIPNVDFVWRSSSPETASVSASGVVTVRRIGSFSINAMTTSGNAISGSQSFSVYGPDAIGGTLRSGSSVTGTALSMRYVTANGWNPTEDLSVTVTGPSGWNGGRAATFTYPRDRSSHYVLLENAPALTGSYTVSVAGGGSATFGIDATQTLNPVTNLKMQADYTVTSLGATWDAITGSSLEGGSFEARVRNTASGQTVAQTQNSYYGSTNASVYASPALDPNQPHEFQVFAMSPQIGSYASGSVFNAARASVPIDFRPKVTELSVGGGPTAGGINLVIRGKFFGNGATVKFGSTASSSVAVDNSEQITAVIPAGSVGTVDVTVTTTPGTSTASAASKFSYFSIAEYDMTSDAKLAAGPDGNVWFVENGSNIGKITPTGTISRYALPTGWSGSYVQDIVTGPDNKVWVSSPEIYNGTTNPAKFARFNTDGTFTEYTAPAGSGGFGQMAPGSDGNLWVTYRGTPKIAKINPANGNTIAEYPLPLSSAVGQGEMILGPDDNVWFVDQTSGKVGRVTPSGTIAMFPVSSYSNGYGLTRGPDGNLWGAGSGISRVTPSGTVTTFDGIGAYDIALGADDRLWYKTDWYYYGSSAPRIGRMSTSGERILVALPASNQAGVFDIVAGSGGKIWYSRGTKIGVITP